MGVSSFLIVLQTARTVANFSLCDRLSYSWLDPIRQEIVRHRGALMLQYRFVVIVSRCDDFSKFGWKCDPRLKSFSTYGTHCFGHLAHITLGIFGNVCKLMLFTHWLDIGSGHKEKNIWFSVLRGVLSPDSIAGCASTEPSVSGCNQSGKESPPTFDDVMQVRNVIR